MYWRYTSLMILPFSVGRIVQLENTVFPHPCHLDVWVNCCLRLSWAACVLCILNRSRDLLFWEPPSFSTLGKQLMQQWFKIDRQEHLMSHEAFLSAAGLGIAHEVKPLWSSSDLCVPSGHTDVWELFHGLAEHPCLQSAPEVDSWGEQQLEHLRTHSEDQGSESGQPQARALVYSRITEEQRCLSQIPLEFTISEEVKCAWEAFFHWLWRQISTANSNWSQV